MELQEDSGTMKQSALFHNHMACMGIARSFSRERVNNIVIS